jgi:hypothetical protein
MEGIVNDASSNSSLPRVRRYRVLPSNGKGIHRQAQRHKHPRIIPLLLVSVAPGTRLLNNERRDTHTNTYADGMDL